METSAPPMTIAQHAAEVRGRVIPQYSISPLPVVAAATSLGYGVSEFTPTDATSDISGAVRHDQKLIFVNATEAPVRKRFTIAHEIGHIVLHAGDGNIVDYRRQIDCPASPQEREANEFAAELLMPKPVFASAWNLCGGNIAGIADMLQVSQQAAEIRDRHLRLT